MSRTCRSWRAALLANEVGDRATLAHRESCTACRSFAERWEAARAALAAGGSNARPDASFAARVSQQLHRRQPVDALGWAAGRLLPASLALAVLLVWFAFRVTPDLTAQSEGLDEAEDPLSWVIDSGSGS